MKTRRDFMKLAVAGVATSAIAETALQSPKNTRTIPAPSGAISVHVTSGEKRFQQQESVTWSSAKRGSKNVIVLDESQSFQEILGFGAALTDAACHKLNDLPSAKRDAFLHELFDPAQMACSVSRICIGSSDYSCKAYSYCDEADPELKHFSMQHDQENILPVLRAVRAINPDTFFLASPWSPPGWMKSSGTMLGGAMTKRHYATYANYIIRFLQEYEKSGIRVNALTSQNEVDTDQDGKMPACLWGQEYEAEFIVRELGPQLRKNNLDTKIWLLDHNYDLWGRATCQLDRETLNPYIDGVAWHGYVGKPESMTRVHSYHPDKHMYFTEGGSDIAERDYVTNWVKWSTTFAGILRNWARCIVVWNYALDENGGPNIGPFKCSGMTTINSQTGEITRNGIFWAMAHYSRVVRRGARRIESTGEIAGVSHVAFINPDRSYCSVLTNAGEARDIMLQLGTGSVEITLQADSVTTLSWGV